LRADVETTSQSLRAGLELAEQIGPPTGHYPLAGYANLARAALWLWEHGPATAAGDYARLSAEAQRRLNRYARTFPIGRPAAQLWRGTSRYLCGRPESAIRHWRRAIALARSLRMPYEEALAHRELASRLPQHDPRRKEHEEAGRELCEALALTGKE
jgi:hypothetical protein